MKQYNLKINARPLGARRAPLKNYSISVLIPEKGDFLDRWTLLARKIGQQYQDFKIISFR